MKKTFLMACAFLGTLVGCTKPIPADLSKINFIPLPVEVKATGTSYHIDESTMIYVNEKEMTPIAQFLSEQIYEQTGIHAKLGDRADAGKGIVLSVGADNDQLGAEGYQMDITEKAVNLRANKAAGVFMGIQTLLQAIEKAGEQEQTWIVASGTITDYPQYGYRGAMLDVSRHFFGVDVVKRFIDLMAMYKLNALHLHLSDDQGWRIEIKSWPKLAEVGGQTQVGGGKGGFYTQEDYKEIIRYAKERFITIIPEIDMPGHTNAAYVAYPQFNGTGKKADLYTGTEVGFSTFDTRKEETYQFVDDIIGELAAITEGPYIHIGGDESHVTKHDDYVYFINRVRDIVKKHNKIMIGWDEVAHADVDAQDVVQYWAKGENAKLGKSKGAKVLMSPGKRAYLDMQYDSTTHIGLHWAAYIEVDAGYNWDPATLEEGINKEDILGVESPLWSETVVTTDDMDYLVFPRLIGHAEIGWTAVEKRKWDEYKVRLGNHGPRLKAKGVNFYRSKLVPWKED